MQNEASTSNQESVKKLGELIRGIRFATLVSLHEDGQSLHARPMATLQADFDGHLWFFTTGSSQKVSELIHNSRVCLSYAKPEDQRWVSVYGRAQVLKDEAKARQLWNPTLRAWFPNGVEDPDLRLLRVDVDDAEYWDSPSSTMVQIVGFAKAILTGKRLEHSGDHGHVNLPH